MKNLNNKIATFILATTLLPISASAAFIPVNVEGRTYYDDNATNANSMRILQNQSERESSAAQENALKRKLINPNVDPTPRYAGPTELVVPPAPPVRYAGPAIEPIIPVSVKYAGPTELVVPPAPPVRYAGPADLMMPRYAGPVDMVTPRYAGPVDMVTPRYAGPADIKM